MCPGKALLYHVREEEERVKMASVPGGIKAKSGGASGKLPAFCMVMQRRPAQKFVDFAGGIPYCMFT
jgi:hypothetical protein